MSDDSRSGDFADESRGLVLDGDSVGPTLAIAFGGIASRLGGIAPFEFLSALDPATVRRVFVRDLDQCWYQQGVRGVSSDLEGTTAALRAMIERMGVQRVVTVGTSAGGFAAIYFGCQLGVDGVVAFAPQTFTSRRLRAWHRDRRWAAEIANVDRLDQARVCRDIVPVVARAERECRAPAMEIHYGSEVRIDRVHARRLARFGSVVVHEHPGGHNVAKSLRDRGELGTVLGRLATAVPQESE
jgi:hypothetical protein